MQTTLIAVGDNAHYPSLKGRPIAPTHLERDRMRIGEHLRCDESKAHAENGAFKELETALGK